MISGSIPSVTNSIQAASEYASAWRTRANGKEQQEPNVDTKDNETSAADQQRTEEMKATDRAVRTHEAAHMAAGGSLVTSGASYTYEIGPDGQRYAVAGEVGIDTSRGRTPEETLIRSQQIRAAALAPADPSPQDRAVAAAASQMAAQARAEIASGNMEKNKASAPPENDAAENGSRADPFAQAIERDLRPGSTGLAVDIHA